MLWLWLNKVLPNKWTPAIKDRRRAKSSKLIYFTLFCGGCTLNIEKATTNKTWLLQRRVWYWKIKIGENRKKTFHQHHAQGARYYHYNWCILGAISIIGAIQHDRKCDSQFLLQSKAIWINIHATVNFDNNWTGNNNFSIGWSWQIIIIIIHSNCQRICLVDALFKYLILFFAKINLLDFDGIAILFHPF